MTDFSSSLVKALERAWAQIRRRHKEVPNAVVVVASGSVDTGRRGALKLGHWGASRWQLLDGELAGEVQISGEGLQHGGGQGVLGTLLHEAAHALATARELSDTSRGGRYHNQTFKALAEELGLVVTKHEVYGWQNTELADVGPYGRLIAQLDKAIGEAFRQMEPTGVTKPKAPSRLRLAECACGRKIRMSLSVFDEADITCGGCGEVFELVEG